MTLLSERGESNKTNANKVLYGASYEAPLTRKTRLYTDKGEQQKKPEEITISKKSHLAVLYMDHTAKLCYDYV